MQFSTLFKIKQYQLSPVISVHVEKQCSSPLKEKGETILCIDMRERGLKVCIFVSVLKGRPV